MATLALYRSDGAPQQITIEAIHLNFWILPSAGIGSLLRALSLRGGYRCYLDIGIRLSVAGDGACPPYLEFLPPVPKASLASFADLSSEVTDRDISDLIFGSNVTVRDGFIVYEQSDMKVEEQVVRVAELRSLPNGRYRAVLESPAQSGGRYYARFRYECGDVRSLLRDKGWAFAKRGWVFDLRINDVRETLSRPPGTAADHMLDCRNAYVFLIAPDTFVPALSSPILQYARLLETRVWDRYLYSCKGVKRTSRSTIYYWRSEGKSITTTKPLRTYMHLHREFGLTILLIYAAGVIVLPWVSGFFSWVAGLFPLS